MKFSIKIETSGNALAAVYLPANGTAQLTIRDGIETDTAEKQRQGKASVAGNVSVLVCWGRF